MNSVVHVAVKLTRGPRLLGLVFMLAGIFSILSPQLLEVDQSDNRSLWIGLAFALIGLLASGIYSGIEVDMSGKRFRNFRAFLGIKLGDWTDIPALNGIYLFSQTEEFTSMPNGITPTLSGNVTDFYVMGISTDTKPVFSLAYEEKAKAQEAAEKISKGLEVSLR